MASLYRCSNVYIAPYQAEGFNLPALESVASGTPVIVPLGGSTDDFTRSKFARYVKASISETIHPGTHKPINRVLKVDEDSLFTEMKFVLDDHGNGMKWLKKASKAASKFAIERYQWKDIVRNLLEYLAGDNPCIFQLLQPDINNEL
jgi:glycosyltransferase involved in cell wall biosynthesis